jgi:hypothetical protein
MGEVFFLTGLTTLADSLSSLLFVELLGLKVENEF